MTQKASFVQKVKVIVKAIAYHSFPKSYENLREFVLEAKKNSFVITMKELLIPNNQDSGDNSFTSPLSYCGGGMMYFHLRGNGEGKKRDIVCDIPIGYCSLQYEDLKSFSKLENEKKEEIKKIFNFFVIPLTIQEIS